MTTFVFTCLTLGIIGAVSTILSFIAWRSYRALADDIADVRECDIIEPPLIVLRDERPFAPAKLAEIFSTWDPKDERWRAVVQLVDAAAWEAQAAATAAGTQENTHRMAHAHGEWTALMTLLGTIQQLRTPPPPPPVGRRPADL